MNGIYNIGDVVLDDWKLVHKIGEGSYGTVFDAVHTDAQFGKEYHAAIKVITIAPKKSDTEDEATKEAYYYSLVSEMIREIDLMYQLKGDSNIVSYEGHSIVAHQGKIGWDIIIRMELLTPLVEYVKKEPFSYRQIMSLGIDICKALEVCQKYNIIHRDIKEANIFVSNQGHFKLGDFGVARILENASDEMSLQGTYAYMAPEIYLGKSYGASIDIYSLGIVLYRCLNNGRSPFFPPYPEEVTVKGKEKALKRRMNGEQITKPVKATDQLAAIVLKACAYDPLARYSSPWAMQNDLAKLLYSEEEMPWIFASGDLVEQHDSKSGHVTPKDDAETVIDHDVHNDELAETVVDTVREREKGIKGKEQQLENGRKVKKMIAFGILALVSISIAIGSFLIWQNRTKENRYNEYLRNASDLYDKNLDGALSVLDEAIAIAPDRTEAYQLGAYALFSHGRYQECVEFLADAENLDNDAIRIAASANFELGDYQKAADYYFTLSQNTEDLSIEDMRDYAVCMGRIGRMDAATAIFVMLTEKGARPEVTDYVLGEAYYAKKEYENAQTYFNKVLASTSDEVLIKRCYLSLTETYRDAENYEMMEQSARAGLKTMPNHTVLMEMLGSACYSLAEAGDIEKYKEAASWFERVTSSGVSKPYLYANVVMSYMNYGSYDSAEAAARKMVDVFPKNDTAHALLSMVLVLLENEKDASLRNYAAAYSEYEAASQFTTSEADHSVLQQLEGVMTQLQENGWLHK